jgi:hypothetical protein
LVGNRWATPHIKGSKAPKYINILPIIFLCHITFELSGRAISEVTTKTICYMLI